MNDKIYDKISKLLSLANGSNFEDESNTALNMANALMEQYGISMTEIDEKSRESEYGKLTNSLKEKKLFKIWEKELLNALARLFYCRVVFTHDGSRKLEARVLGRESNVRTVILMNDWIANKIKEDSKKKFSETKQRNSYIIGCVANITSRISKTLKERETTFSGETGLVPVNEVEQFMKNEFKHLFSSKQSSKASDASAFCAGMDDGSKIGLNKQFGLKAIA